MGPRNARARVGLAALATVAAPLGPGLGAAPANAAPGAGRPASGAGREPVSGPGHDGVVRHRYRDVTHVVSAGRFEKIYDPSVGEDRPWYINDHTVVRGPDGTWHLFGITHAEPAAPEDEDSFAHATAPTLHGPWTKQPSALDVDPGYGETHLWAPYVMSRDGVYYMFYAGGGPDPTRSEINLATSRDLYHWTRQPGGPLFRDGFEARDPMVLRVGDHWVMYYCASSETGGGHHVVAYRTSADLVHWGDRHIAYTSPDTGTGGGDTESPFVVHRHGRYYLFIGPCGAYAGGSRGYRCTDVLRSRDPLHFDASRHVGRLDAHAAEVVQDTDGRWYATHAGWGMGGVYLAPLDWSRRQTVSGVRVRARDYRLDVSTAPTAELRSYQTRVAGRWKELLDDGFRGTGPYAGIGGFGDTDRAGAARAVRLPRRSDVVSVEAIPIGDEPVSVDWRFKFTGSYVDMSMRWHVNGKLSAPAWEAGWSLDSVLPRVGDPGDLDRPAGDAHGFSPWTMSGDDQVSLVAAYREGSAWNEANRWFEPHVGEVAWQPLWGFGLPWPVGDYDGGTWRIGVSGHREDVAFADSLYAGINGNG
ncbi:MAG: family 43 glycosylhydrolase [Marmoricola sp.]